MYGNRIRREREKVARNERSDVVITPENHDPDPDPGTIDKNPSKFHDLHN